MPKKYYEILESAEELPDMIKKRKTDVSVIVSVCCGF